MEKLIELLFDNIYFVIVIVGFVLSALGKTKGSGRGAARRMPDFGGNDSSSEEWEMPQQRDPQSAEYPFPGHQPSTERAHPVLTELGSNEAPVKRQTPRAAAAPASVKQSTPASELDSAAMRKAVVWAEILGPPRAKRPWNKS
ncbi:hypothetical protein [Paenibacillus xylaniclasticus]|uniref:hypothetical protein n=1 Tax=Paenibacillus xylaniclasticus TaxID=588083 RepID=UPI000FD7878C|nr:MULTISPECIES: hypothetical protein [Paenibacillus]GFN30336.1 hypothetical protein PCURB6_05960 [Paenibacillus curdlanolyticus]